MALTTKEISNLVVSMFDAAAGAANLTSLESYVATQAPTYSLADLANDLAMSPLYTEQYNGMDNAAKADALASQFGLTKNMFGLYDTQEEQDAYNFFKDSLDAGSTTQDLQVAALTYLSDPANAASFPVASATLANKEAVAQYYSITQGHSAATVADLQAVLANVTDSSASVTDAEAAIDSAVGQTFNLNDGVDNLIGTALNDTFNANLNQSAQMGGVVANTLATGDSIDGGAGTDTLSAQLTDQANWYNNETDVQPMTTSVENVQIEAQDYTQGGGSATLDAKNMTGVDKIGSYYSDGDLVIENLTTLTDNNTIRNTSDLTVTMDHTDNFDHDGDASDLTVLFDQDYLVTGKTTSGAQLTVRMENAVENVNGGNSIAKFDSLVFSVGGTNVTVDLTAIAADTTLTPATAYAAVVNAINAQLAADGFTTVSAALAPIENSVFSIPVAGHAVGDSAGQYYPIVITNSGPELLAGVNIVTAADASDTDLNNSFSAIDPTTNTNPVSINVELNKVGRDGEGGNLNIGAKQVANMQNTDVSKHNGIEQFNITVKGDASKPSNLGTITSTNGTLKTVNIASETRDDDSYAALTVRGTGGSAHSSASPFGGTLTTLNANSFLGDLYIGQVTYAQNIDTFTATGGGDVTLNEDIFAGSSLNSSDTFPSLDANAYSVTTGSGSDNLNINATDGAQLTVTSGAGDDKISVSINGADDSGSTPTFATINSSGGDNTVTVTSNEDTHLAEITLGGGNDTVYGNSVNITANTGAGNDTVYADNMGTDAVVVNTVANNTVQGALTITSSSGGAGATTDQSNLLYGRSVVVTLATDGNAADDFTNGFESVAVKIQASNGYLTTTSDLHNAIADAINTDPVLSKLAHASVDSNGELQVHYLVDGTIDVSANAPIEYKISGDYADLTSTEQAGILNQLKADSHDSDLQASSLQSAYNTTNITTAQDITDNNTGTDGVDSTHLDSNVINGGLGDDVLVLNSSDDSATTYDTVKIDANGFGHDTIVHFTVDSGTTGIDGDVLDFAFLDNSISLSGSTVSQQDIAGTVADNTHMGSNTVTEATFSDVSTAYGSGAISFDTLTNAQVLDALNGTAAGGSATTFANVAANTDLAQTEQHSILMVDDPSNAGYYKVFEVVSHTDGGNSDFVSATLVGTLDFGHDVALVSDDIA